MASANLYKHPATFPPIPAVVRILARFDRPKLEGFIAVALDLLDVVDGDPDEEANGDELDCNKSEDDFMAHERNGPGCPVSDAAEEDLEDCDGFENEPLFERRQCKRLNRLYGDGPGGGNLLDSDCGDEEAGEREEGRIPAPGTYDIDQRKFNYDLAFRRPE